MPVAPEIYQFPTAVSSGRDGWLILVTDWRCGRMHPSETPDGSPPKKPRRAGTNVSRTATGLSRERAIVLGESRILASHSAECRGLTRPKLSTLTESCVC